MSAEDNVIINFLGNTEGLVPVENALDGIIQQSDEVGSAWKQTSEKMNSNSKTISDTTNKLAKSIDDLAVAAKSMDKVAIGGAYKEYLKQLQTQLGLTSQELKKYLENARATTQQKIITSQDNKEIGELQLSLEVINDQLKAFGSSVNQASEPVVTLRSRLRNAREELALVIEQQGQSGAAFDAAAAKVGHLEKEMKHLNEITQNTGSDTANLRGVIDLLGGAAGAFAVTKGAAALFGDESEDVQKALLKVNAAMEVLQGLQEVQLVLEKSSAGSMLINKLFFQQKTAVVVENSAAQAANTEITQANVVAEGEQAVATGASTAALGEQVVATEAATEATAALNSTMLLNPVALIVTGVVELAAAIYLWKRNASEAEKEQEKLNSALAEATTFTEIDIKALEHQSERQLALAKERGTSVVQLAKMEGDAGNARLKTLDDARVAAAKVYNEAKDNDEKSLEEKKKLLEAKIELEKKYEDERNALELKAIEFRKLKAEEELKSFIAFQEAKVAGTIAGSDAEKTAQIAAIRAISEEKKKSAEYKALTPGEQAKMEADDVRQIQGLELQRYQHFLKGKTDMFTSYLDDAKIRMLKNQSDSIQSIHDIADAEIVALEARKKEQLSNPTLNDGERRKIEEDAALQVVEIRKKEKADLLAIEKKHLEDVLALDQKGSLAEYNDKVALIAKEQEIELASSNFTEQQKQDIRNKYQKQREEALKAFYENQYQTEISQLNAELDRFGITEKEKLSLTIDRINAQRQIEILAAENNAAKIAEINAKYDKQILEQKKVSIKAELEDNLKTLDVFGANSKAINEKIANDDKSSIEQKKAALKSLLDAEELKFDIEKSNQKKLLDDNLITQHEYDVAVQDIENKRTAAEISNEQRVTAAMSKEIAKRTAAIQGIFDFVAKGLSALGPDDAISKAINDLNNFAAKTQEVFAKLKAGLIDSKEAMKEIVSSAVGAMQDIANQIFADNAAQRAQELTDTIQTLEDQKNAELANANLTKQQQAAINKKYADKEKAEKLAAWKADQEAKKEQAIINGALAITNALATAPTVLAGIALAALIGLETAVEVTKISQAKPPKFRHGKVDIKGPGTPTSDSIPAMISTGESVIKAESTAKWKDALIAINENRFEDYLHNKFKSFVFPHIGDDVQPAFAKNGIDYEVLAYHVASQMKGIIPAPAQVHNTIDEHGLHSFVTKGKERTEFKNKKYKMS